MGYVPFSKEKATLQEKQNIARKLVALGITNKESQIQFMANLLDRDEFTPALMSRQDCVSLSYKLNNIKAAKETR